MILPKSKLQRRNWYAGAPLIAEATADSVLLKSLPLFKPTRPEDVFGSLRYSGRKEMDAAVLAEAKRRYARD